MVFNCKVFDGNGNLKKVIKTDEIILEKGNLFLKEMSHFGSSGLRLGFETEVIF